MKCCFRFSNAKRGSLHFIQSQRIYTGTGEVFATYIRSSFCVPLATGSVSRTPQKTHYFKNSHVPRVFAVLMEDCEYDVNVRAAEMQSGKV